ncbi:hypothetical protein BXT86_03980 [candidate division WOR-3 bacterium 4484_100]|uniref:Permease n=1 Tax=candidate division WOR-3 bacterium 4484_100 TaxID=1936077 RepID=A0A1V4QEY5_UNCW3|nr:MAG: hypothetical protein BXT86_03980 [candidate division WOR-3 bacterium 4484_100]
MKSKNLIKTVLTWGLLLFGLLMLVYPKIAHHPFFPIFKYQNLNSYGPLIIPVVYLWSYLTRAWGAFIFAFMFGGIIAAFIPTQSMRRMFSGKSIKSYFFAAAFAPVLTICSCAMIPIFGGILIAGAGIGPAISFLLMAPAANILALLFTGEIISWKLALARLIFSFFGAIIIGYILDKTPWGKAEEKRYGSITAARTSVGETRNFYKKSADALNEAWGLTSKALPFLLLGVAAVSYVEAYLPKEVVATFLTGSTGIFLGAAIGVPMYTPTLVEVFLVKGLINLGMSPGAAIAFLIGAPMASIPSMLGVSRLINWRCVVNYAILAIIIGIIAGFLYMGIIGTL